MAGRLQRVLSFVAMCLVCVIAPGCASRSVTVVPLPDAMPAEALPQTDVLPHTADKIVAGRNYVYCATFQIAWNKMQNDVIGEPIRLTGSPPMADFLNKQSFTESDLAADAYLAMVGKYEDGIIDAIRKKMQSRFPSARFQPPPDPQQPAYVAFAYLEKTLAFNENFDRLETPLRFHAVGGDVSVASFGYEYIEPHTSRGHRYAHQAEVLDYVGPDDLVIRLNTESTDDELILAKVKPLASLQATIESVMERAQSEKSHRLDNASKLAIPIINVGVDRHYQELVGRNLLNQNYQRLFIFWAEQSIRFRLDETGARLESQADVLAAESKPLEEPVVFDKPFLIYLRERKSPRPYFAAWIETPELLAPLR